MQHENRHRPDSSHHREVIDVSRHLETAKKLLADHPEVLRTEISATKMGKSGIETAMSKLPDDVLERFWGHGVARGTKEDQIVAALSLIDDKLMAGDSAPLKNEIYNPYGYGGFLVLSPPDKMLLATDETGHFEIKKIKIGSAREMNAVQINVGAIVCNDEMDALVEPLRAIYPNVKILHASELEDYLQQ